MEKKKIKSLIFEACHFYGLDITCKKLVSARNFVRYSGEIKSKKNFPSFFVEEYLSYRTRTAVFVDVNRKGKQFHIDISKPVFKALTYDEAISKGELGWNFPILLGEKTNGKIMSTDLKIAKHIFVAGNDGYGKTNMLNVFRKTLTEANGKEKLILFTVDLASGDIDCNDSEFLKFTTKEWFYENVIEGTLQLLEWLNIESVNRIKLLLETDEFGVRMYQWCPKIMKPYFVLMLDGVEEFERFARMRDLAIYTRNLCLTGAFVGIHIILAQNIDSKTGGILPPCTLLEHIPTRIGFKFPDIIKSSYFMDTREAASLKYPGEAIVYNATEKTSFRLQTPWIGDFGAEL